jgi:hypothetical protein
MHNSLEVNDIIPTPWDSHGTVLPTARGDTTLAVGGVNCGPGPSRGGTSPDDNGYTRKMDWIGSSNENRQFPSYGMTKFVSLI